MTDELYTLQDLATAAGVEKRTIRSWIEQDLLRGPETMGRGARYSKAHLERTKAIKCLKDIYGISLSLIRRELLLADKEKISKLAREFDEKLTGFQQIISDHGGTDYVIDTFGKELTALEYIKLVQSKLAENKKPCSDWELGPEEQADDISTKLVVNVSGSSAVSVARKAKAVAWYRISVTPEIELHVSGVIDPSRLTEFERLADHIREIITGGFFG